MTACYLPHAYIIYSTFYIRSNKGLNFHLVKHAESIPKQLPQALQRFLWNKTDHGQHP